MVILGGKKSTKKGIETLFPTLYKSIITPVMQIKSEAEATSIRGGKEGRTVGRTKQHLSSLSFFSSIYIHEYAPLTGKEDSCIQIALDSWSLLPIVVCFFFFCVVHVQ